MPNYKVSPQGSCGEGKRKSIEGTKQKLLSKRIDLLDKKIRTKVTPSRSICVVY